MNEAMATKPLGKKLLEEAFQRMSKKDLEMEVEKLFKCALTGAYIRGFYHNKLQSSDKEFIKVFIDANGLKRINDSQGHEAGDIYISNIAEVCSRFTRNEDILIRWGGDEFILFVRTDDVATVRAIKQRLNCALESKNLSAAIGIGYTIDEADKNMYSDKKYKKSLYNKLATYFKTKENKSFIV